MSSKSNSSPNNLSAFVTFHGLRSTGYKYLTKHRLNNLLSSKVGLLVKPFLGWFKSFGNLI